MNKKLFLFLTAVSLTLFPILCHSSGQKSQLTIILVRHAEKEIVDSSDPPLTEKGKARAAELSSILKHIPLTAIFSTPYTRTRETVLPVSTEKGITIEYYNTGSEIILLEKIFDRYKSRRTCVLIAGHSNTIHLFLNTLVGDNIYSPIDDEVYDNIYIATASAPGTATILHMRFGEHTVEKQIPSGCILQSSMVLLKP